MRDRRRQQRQWRRPTQPLRQHKIGEPQGKNFRVDAAHRQGCAEPVLTAAPSGFSTVELSYEAASAASMSDGRSRHSRRPRRVGAGRREETPQAMQASARRRRGVKPADARVAQRPFVFTQPRHRGASGGGAQGETLTQRAGKGRLGAALAGARNIGAGVQNVIEERERCSGAIVCVGRVMGRAAAGFRPMRKSLDF
jgi:hypothetical protein